MKTNRDILKVFFLSTSGYLYLACGTSLVEINAQMQKLVVISTFRARAPCMYSNPDSLQHGINRDWEEADMTLKCQDTSETVWLFESSVLCLSLPSLRFNHAVNKPPANPCFKCFDVCRMIVWREKRDEIRCHTTPAFMCMLVLCFCSSAFHKAFTQALLPQQICISSNAKVILIPPR